MWLITLCVLALVVVSFTHWVYRWRNPKCNGKLPPGSMGLPLLGETLQFIAPNQTNWDVHPFFQERMRRYGSVFRTSIIGLKVIVSTDSDLNYKIFQKENQFQHWYPDSFSKILGKQNVSTSQGALHKYLKNMVLSLVGSGNLSTVISEVDYHTKRKLKKWASQEILELKDATGDLAFGLSAKKLISYDIENSSEKLRADYEYFIKGLMAFPIAIPGTSYYKCLQGRKKLKKMLMNMLDERRKNPNKSNDDFFDYVIEELKQDDAKLTEEISLDLMLLLLFVSYETISTAMLVTIKLLTDNPRVLKELTEEHEKIIRERENPDSGLTWQEYKSMTFTFKVIFESVRLANLATGMFRKATTDFKFKDYTIPAGWVVMACIPAVHLDPSNYKDPIDFNPWRWKEKDLKIASKTYMAFGGGQRFCVGAEFAKFQIAVFLHHLVTKYRWKLIKGGEMVRTPSLQFPNGFHVEFVEKDKQD
ncbi:cytochrome P450 87A3-like [Rutidosis leptorrhynchoides]|uniref:cytochrome P450 87A3-like n=1 Tax=Rutidosis leptorrhynchoides TaxID=125765 RepID=UPI003A9903A7